MADQKSDIASKPGSSGWKIALGRASSGDRPYLGSMDDVHEVVRKFCAGIIDRFILVSQGDMPRDDAVAADQEACRSMAAVFLGQSDEYQTMGDWNDSGAIAAGMRKRFSEHFEDDDAPSDDMVMTQSFALLVHAVYDVLTDEDADPVTVSGYVSWMTLALMGLPIKGES
jgi:hypothetical protein